MKKYRPGKKKQTEEKEDEISLTYNLNSRFYRLCVVCNVHFLFPTVTSIHRTQRMVYGIPWKARICSVFLITYCVLCLQFNTRNQSEVSTYTAPYNLLVSLLSFWSNLLNVFFLLLLIICIRWTEKLTIFVYFIIYSPCSCIASLLNHFL